MTSKYKEGQLKYDCSIWGYRFHKCTLLRNTTPNIHQNIPPYKQTNFKVFSPQVNYTDWMTAIGQQLLVPTFADRGVLHGQSTRLPTVVNLDFLDQSHYSFFQAAPHLPSQVLVEPIPDPLLLRKSGRVSDLTWDLWIRGQELWPQAHIIWIQKRRQNNIMLVISKLK
jgi:hypothetical protein